MLARELRPPGAADADRDHLPDRVDDARARRRDARASAPGRCRHASSGSAAAFETRGGVVGQGELWVTSHLISTLGADILAVFLFVGRA